MTVWELVNLLSHKLNLPADRVWEMSVGDICLTLKEPVEKVKSADHATAQKSLCLAFDERLARLKALTLEQRVELENWKAHLM